MTALAADRDTHEYAPWSIEFELPVADNVKIWNGAMVGIDANGRLAPCTLSTTIKPVGRSIMLADNTVVGHTAGGITCKFHIGVFRWANVGGITIAQRGQIVYAADDNSVQISSIGASAAGPIVDVDASGVWVAMDYYSPSLVDPGTPVNIWTINIPALSTLANAQSFKFTPGFPGRIKSIQFMVTTPVTTAAKAATLTPKIAGVATTGGALALTSANCTPVGAEVDGAAITALNTFTAVQQISVDVSAVTAFVEGAGQVVVVLG